MTDILRPELVWIEGRCYRATDPSINISYFQEHDLYQDEVMIDEMEDDDEEYDINMIDSGRFSTSISVSKHYIGHIIGKKGIMKCRIEKDTKTDIKIPRQGQNGYITIIGSSVANVRAARRRINIIVISARMKQHPTHFISVPMNTMEIVKNFEAFKERVLQECPDRGVEESLFISAHKLHLTLVVMCLMDNEERLFATKVLTDAKNKVLKPILEGHMPLTLRMKDVSYMNDDPTEIDVLFACVEEEGCSKGVLQTMADGLADYFHKSGLIKKYLDRDNVKLHVTLLNSRYRKSSDSNSSTNLPNAHTNSRISFDGSRILKKFANYDFGVAQFNDLHISQMHSVASNGYYESTFVMSCL